MIIEPTIRFDIASSQPGQVNQEKCETYNRTLNCYQSKN